MPIRFKSSRPDFHQKRALRRERRRAFLLEVVFFGVCRDSHLFGPLKFQMVQQTKKAVSSATVRTKLDASGTTGKEVPLDVPAPESVTVLEKLTGRLDNTSISK